MLGNSTPLHLAPDDRWPLLIPSMQQHQRNFPRSSRFAAGSSSVFSSTRLSFRHAKKILSTGFTIFCCPCHAREQPRTHLVDLPNPTDLQLTTEALVAPPSGVPTYLMAHKDWPTHIYPDDSSCVIALFFPDFFTIHH